PGLLDGLQGSELDAAMVLLALVVVLGARQEIERPLRPLQVSLSDLRRLLQLGHFGMLEGAVGDAVLLAKAVVLAYGQKVSVALDTHRLRRPVFDAPIILLLPLAARQGGERGNGPASVMPPVGQAAERCQDERRRDGTPQPRQNAGSPAHWGAVFIGGG